MAYNQAGLDRLIRRLRNGTFKGDKLSLPRCGLNDADVARLMLAINKQPKRSFFDWLFARKKQPLCERLTNIRLTDNQLTTAPDVTKCVNLRWMDLGYNQLTTPPDVTNCINLEALYLGNNQLTTAPDVTKCANLKGLYLGNNQLSTPPDVTNCVNLKELRLYNNQLTTAPDVTKCVNLRWLYLNSNQLTTIAKRVLRAFKTMRPNLNIGSHPMPAADAPFTMELLNQHFAAIVDSWNKNFTKVANSKQSKDIAYNTALALKGLSLQSTTDLQDVTPIVLSYLQPTPNNKLLAATIEQELSFLLNISKNDQQDIKVLQDYAKSIVLDAKDMVSNPILQNAEEDYQNFLPTRAKEAMAQVNKSYDKLMNMTIENFLSKNGFNPEDLSKPNPSGITAIALAKQLNKRELALELEKRKDVKAEDTSKTGTNKIKLNLA